MGRRKPMKRGLWSPDEDARLVDYLRMHGIGSSSWSSVPLRAGIQRCGKSCRFRWMNYLRPGLKRGEAFSAHEQQLILNLHRLLGNKWSEIASHLPGRTDNAIKNFCNVVLRKQQSQSAVQQPSDQAAGSVAPKSLPRCLDLEEKDGLANTNLVSPIASCNYIATGDSTIGSEHAVQSNVLPGLLVNIAPESMMPGTTCSIYSHDPLQLIINDHDAGTVNHNSTSSNFNYSSSPPTDEINFNSNGGRHNSVTIDHKPLSHPLWDEQSKEIGGIVSREGTDHGVKSAAAGDGAFDRRANTSSECNNNKEIARINEALLQLMAAYGYNWCDDIEQISGGVMTPNNYEMHAELGGVVNNVSTELYHQHDHAAPSLFDTNGAAQQHNYTAHGF